MSLVANISKSERIFINHGVDLNIRSDGRSCTDFRNILLEQGVIETCNGSAHARSGNTDVLVGIKLELEEVADVDTFADAAAAAASDSRGRLQIFADISAIASPAFEGRKGEDITCQLEALFAEFLPDYLDLEKLVIVPQKSYFAMHIDIVILECSSFASLVDVTSIAIKTALYDVKIPHTVVLSVEHNEFQVSEDSFQATSLDASKVPLVTSYTKVASKFIVDPTWEEEQASVGTVSIAFFPPDEIVRIKKLRVGSISSEAFPDLYQLATKFGLELAEKFTAKMSEQNSRLKTNGKITFSLN